MIKNFISLGTLEAKGCKYSTKDGVLVITKDGRLIMSARRLGNVYILQGSTVTGAATVITVLSS